MDIKRVLYFVLLLTCFYLNQAEECLVDGVKDWTQESPLEINDTFAGTLVILNTTGVKEAYMNDSKYFNVSLDDNDVLTLSTTPLFGKYEEEEDEASITLTIVLICDEEETDLSLEYSLHITDENNHDPEFIESEYNYTFYDKLPQSYDFFLSDFKPIVAKDVDITNEKVTFEIEENDYFKIEYGAALSEKEHEARLSNNIEISAPFKETYNLTVTDDGEPHRKSIAFLTVEVIATVDPEFTEKLYIAEVTPTLEIFVENGPITLKNGLDGVTVALAPSENTGYFEVSIDEEIKLKANANVTDLLSQPALYVILYIEATIDSVDHPIEAAVLVTTEILLNGTSEEESTYNYVNVELHGFNYWISASTTLNVLIVVFSTIGILIAIFYLNLRINRRQY